MGRKKKDKPLSKTLEINTETEHKSDSENEECDVFLKMDSEKSLKQIKELEERVKELGNSENDII